MGRSDRPEHTAPPEIFYNEEEARKYTDNTRMISIQTSLTERALELLSLPQDGTPRLLLDLGCGSGLSGEALTEQGHTWVVSGPVRSCDGRRFQIMVGTDLPVCAAAYSGTRSQWGT